MLLTLNSGHLRKTNKYRCPDAFCYLDVLLKLNSVKKCINKKIRDSQQIIMPFVTTLQKYKTFSNL